MYNITLIATIHLENGQSNPDELYKILEDINPEVVFDELPIYFADMYYNDSYHQQLEKLPIEVKCILKYKQKHHIKIIPVDIDVTQKLSKYQAEILFLFSTFYKNNNYIKLDGLKDTLIAREGFNYLNSDSFLNLLEEKEVIEKKIIESDTQKERLFAIYKLFHEKQYDERENAMLENIYNYSKENKYNKAVFLIGAEHKKSIIQKITKYEKLSEIKLSWRMYGKD